MKVLNKISNFILRHIAALIIIWLRMILLLLVLLSFFYIGEKLQVISSFDKEISINQRPIKA